MHKKWIIFSLITLLQFLPTPKLLAQDDAASVIKADFSHFVDVGLGLLKAPAHFDGSDWLYVGGAVTGTALISLADRSAKSFALRNQTRFNDGLFGIDNYDGNHYSLFLSVGIYGYGFFSGDKSIRRMGLRAYEAFVYAGFATTILKVLISRRRPYLGDDPYVFKPINLTNNDYLSLPSGHTTVAWAVSTALAKSHEGWLWKSFWYGTAGLVSGARMYHNKHWLSDVVFGGIIGYTIADYIVGFDSKPTHKSTLDIHPYLGYRKVGLRLNF